MTGGLALPERDVASVSAIVGRARSTLEAAKNSAEVIEAIEVAAFAYDAAKTAARFAACNELKDRARILQAEALEIETAAQRRLADEYDAAQERGEVVGPHEGAKKRVPEENAIATVSDLGLTRKDIHEARQIRDAEVEHPGIVRETLDKLLDAGEEPTRAAVKREIVARGEKEILEAAKAIRTERADEKRAARTTLLNTLSNRNAPLPQDRRYSILYADPPWQYDFSPSNDRSVENHYPTMPIEEICALRVADLATPDAMLFLWAPPSFIKKGLLVLEAWGFELATSMVWVKDKIGTGIYVRQRHEYLLLGKRGQPITPRPGSQPDSVIEAPRSQHSAKPAEVYDVIDRMYPGLSRIELFARSPREGWDAWGNEVVAEAA